MNVAVSSLAPSAQRRVTLALIAAVLVVVAIAYHGALARMAQSWERSDSYSHGWLIVPICLYLVWRRREALRAASLAPNAFYLLGVAAAVLLWLAGALANALVVQQLAIVGMIAAAIAAVCGTASTRIIAFPLAFLVFAVPFGEPLVEPLMQWTATGTIALLRLSGIPVFRDGMLFSTSAGDFEVARACSGIRYLTASAAVGLLYGHLALRRRATRVVFAVLAVTVPILANAFRAYLIVVLAHLSDMRIATGVDHFIYGWVFFGLVMLGVIWIGERMRRRERLRHTAIEPSPAGGEPAPPRDSLRFPHALAIAGAAAALILAGPFFAQRAEAALARPAPLSEALPQGADAWRGPLPSASAWRPSFVGEPSIVRGDYEHPEHGRVTVAVVAYAVETQDSELIGGVNALADPAAWRFVSSRSARIDGDAALEVTRYESLDGPRWLQVWSTYALDGDATTSELAVKLRGTLRRLRDPPAAAALIAIAREHEGRGAAEAALADFARTHLDALLACADDADPGGARCGIVP